MTLTLGNSGHFKFKNHIFALFSKSIAVIPTKHDRNIPRGEEHLSRNMTLTLTVKNMAILKVKNCILHFSLSKLQAILHITPNLVSWGSLHYGKADAP